MPSCAISGCKNHNRNADKLGIWFHRFPKEEKLRKLWVYSCRRTDKFNIENARICSSHFNANDYERDLRAELLNIRPANILKRNAIPHLLIPNTFSSSHNLEESPSKKKRVASSDDQHSLSDIDVLKSENLHSVPKTINNSLAMDIAAQFEKLQQNPSFNETNAIAILNITPPIEQTEINELVEENYSYKLKIKRLSTALKAARCKNSVMKTRLKALKKNILILNNRLKTLRRV